MTLGSLGHGIALERHADGGIVFLHGTDNLTTGLDIRYGFVYSLMHGPRLLHCHEGLLKTRALRLTNSNDQHQGGAAAALRPAMRPNAKHSPMFPVPWYR